MSEVKVNKISPRSGTDVTLGDSGDTFTIPAGATLTNNGTASGFAAIDWQSTVVTGTTHTASANQGIWIDTTSNACTLTLPSSPSVGDQLIFSDFARTWASNAVTLTLNGSNYQGNTTPVPVYNTEGETVHIVYSGSTQGWIPINDGAVALETPQTYTADFLVIAGGGAGGFDRGGGGGAGGYRNSYSTESSGGGGSSETSLALIPGTTYTITVGAGGSAPTVPGLPDSGNDSSISGSGITTITSTGGGGAGGNAPTPNRGVASDGGSGGGSAYSGTAGSGTANQGFDGGTNPNGEAPAYEMSGGGGAGEAGDTDGVGHGGDGLSSLITGSAVSRGGGGAGFQQSPSGALPGGTGGGGDSSSSPGGNDQQNGTANTGGGGGGGDGGSPGHGSSGGSGVVILRVPTANYSGTTSGSPTVTTDGTDTILTYTASGSYTG